jgi:hypothetical protein
MDNLARYRQLIMDHISRVEQLSSRHPEPGVDTVCAFDMARDQYFLYSVGLARNQRVCDATLYVRIVNGKIWVEQDLTEDGIANALIRAGVPKEDIVLGFLPPNQRQHAEFAVA